MSEAPVWGSGSVNQAAYQEQAQGLADSSAAHKTRVTAAAVRRANRATPTGMEFGGLNSNAQTQGTGFTPSVGDPFRLKIPERRGDVTPKGVTYEDRQGGAPNSAGNNYYGFGLGNFGNTPAGSTNTGSSQLNSSLVTGDPKADAFRDLYFSSTEGLGGMDVGHVGYDLMNQNNLTPEAAQAYFPELEDGAIQEAYDTIGGRNEMFDEVVPEHQQGGTASEADMLSAYDYFQANNMTAADAIAMFPEYEPSDIEMAFQRSAVLRGR